MPDSVFHRSCLLLGEKAFSRLQSSCVAVIGCGAVGSFATEALARAGVGHLILTDGDTIEKSNINRQLCALHSTLGRFKTDVLTDRIHDIYPNTKVDNIPLFWSQSNAETLFPKQPDFVIDAIDSFQEKVDLICHLQKKKIPFISSMGAALKQDFTRIRTAPLKKTTVCPLAAKLRHRLKQLNAGLDFPCVFSDETPTKAHETGRQMGSLVTITGIFGLIAAGEAIRFLTTPDTLPDTKSTGDKPVSDFNFNTEHIEK